MTQYRLDDDHLEIAAIRAAEIILDGRDQISTSHGWRTKRQVAYLIAEKVTFYALDPDMPAQRPARCTGIAPEGFVAFLHGNGAISFVGSPAGCGWDIRACDCAWCTEKRGMK